jgi:acyl-CoA dehydrogenase family member 9
MAHQSIGLKGVLLCGTEAQKTKYLPKLASGEEIAAFALTEPGTGSDAASVKLTATPVDNGDAYILRGTKMWISNGGIASFYTVFARTVDATGANKVTAFLVHRKEHAGVVPSPPEKKMGIRGSNTCVVTFEDVKVPKENILGELHGGFKVAMQILNNGRFGMGAACGGGIRRLIAGASEYANNRIQFGRPISSFGLVADKFSKMATQAYAIEAMAYMTTSLIDGPGLDMSIEAAMVKVYGSEAQFDAVNECIQILGGMGFSAGGVYPFERGLRDSRILLIFEGSNEVC